MIIDSHAHFWREPHLEVETVGPRRAPIEVDQFVKDMDTAGIDKVVQITRGLMGFDNSYSIEGAARYPDRILVMGRFDARAPNMTERLGAWLNQTNMVGIRLSPVFVDEALSFKDGSLDTFWPEVERLSIPVAIAAPGDATMLGEIAESHPGLTLIVDHVGMRVFDIFKSRPSVADWPNLIALSQYPNVVIKVSAMPEAFVERKPFVRCAEMLHQIYDHFGPDRMMWGSNYPNITQICTYRESLDFILEGCQFLSEQDKTKILGLTAASVLRLPW